MNLFKTCSFPTELIKQQLTAGESFPLAGDRVKRTRLPFSTGLARHTSTVEPSMFLPVQTVTTYLNACITYVLFKSVLTKESTVIKVLRYHSNKHQQLTANSRLRCHQYNPVCVRTYAIYNLVRPHEIRTL